MSVEDGTPLEPVQSRFEAREADLEPALVALLTGPTILGQLAVTLVVPLLPALAAEFSVEAHSQGMILSLFLAGYAAGQLLFGPLSDQFGRRAVLLVGLSLFAAGSVGTAVAESFWMLLTGRLLQGFGAGAGLVVARAAARDCFVGPPLSTVMAVMNAAMTVASGAAPTVGSLLAGVGGWRATMGLAVGIGAVQLVLSWRYLPETNLARVPRLSVPSLMAAYGAVLKERVFYSPVLMNAFCISGLYAFFAGAPSVFMHQFGFSPTAFGLLLLYTSLAYLVGGAAGAIRPSGEGMVGAALALMFVGALANLLQGLVGMATPAGYIAGMTAYGVGLGIVLPIGVTQSLTPFGRQAGIASALLGALHMVAGALGATLVTWFAAENASLAFPAVMFAAVAGAVVTNAEASRSGL